MPVTCMNVMDLGWSHDKIYDHFSDQRPVAQMVVDLLLRKLHPDEVPPLKVVKFGPNSYSLSNRRLYALRTYADIRREFGIHAPVVVPVELCEASSGFAFTTSDEIRGSSVEVTQALDVKMPRHRHGPAQLTPERRAALAKAHGPSTPRTRTRPSTPPTPSTPTTVSEPPAAWQLINALCKTQEPAGHSDVPQLSSEFPPLNGGSPQQRTLVEKEVGMQLKELVIMRTILRLQFKRQWQPKGEVKKLMEKLVPSFSAVSDYGSECLCIDAIDCWLGGYGASLGSRIKVEALLKQLKGEVARASSQVDAELRVQSV